MFAFFLLISAAGAQDYCAITPKHTACGQKVYKNHKHTIQNSDQTIILITEKICIGCWNLGYLRDYLVAC